MRQRFAAVLLAVLGPVGCAVQPEPAGQPVQVPACFSVEGQRVLPQRWWRSLGDERLDGVMERALAGNFDLQATWDRLAQARALARKAGVPRYPSLDVEGSARRRWTRRQAASSASTEVALGLAAGYELDLWGRLRAAWRAAEVDVQVSRQDVEAAAISLTASVATVWYRLAEQLAQQRVLEEQLQANRQLLELMVERFGQGKVQAVDVLRQRQLVEQTEGLGILAAEQVKLLRHELAVLLGRVPGVDEELPEPVLVELPALPKTGVPARWLRRRPDVVSQYLALRAADWRLAGAIADQYPRLSIRAEAGSEAARSRDLFDNWVASLAGNLAQPLFDAGALRAEVERRRAERQEALNRYGQVVLEAWREVEDALAEEGYHRQYLAKLAEQLRTAQSVIERTQTSYINGQLDYLRVLEAVTSRQSLERQYLAARRRQLEIRIALCRALAGPLDLREPGRGGVDRADGPADGGQKEDRPT